MSQQSSFHPQSQSESDPSGPTCAGFGFFDFFFYSIVYSMLYHTENCHPIRWLALSLLSSNWLDARAAERSHRQEVWMLFGTRHHSYVIIINASNKTPEKREVMDKHCNTYELTLRYYTFCPVSKNSSSCQPWRKNNNLLKLVSLVFLYISPLHSKTHLISQSWKIALKHDKNFKPLV